MLRAFFAAEATDCLDRIERAAAEPDQDGGVAIERAMRALAGIARLGEHTRLYNAATAVVTAFRNTESVSDDRLRDTIADLHAFLEETEPAESLDARLAVLKARWGAIDGEGEGQASAPDPEFLSWVAEETAAIADCMDSGVEAFIDHPGDREQLGTILRRQRPLLGAARLTEITIVGETLHAVEDLAALIVRLDVPIKMEWLDVFRSARDVLRAAALRLERGEQPQPINALSRLRTIRHELMDRYGERAVSPPATPAFADEQAVPLEAAAYTPVTTDPEARADAVGPVYESGEEVPAEARVESAAVAPGGTQRSPLERAMELRPVIETGADRAARAAIAELYDILRESLP